MCAASRREPGTRGGPDSLHGQPGGGRDGRNRKRESAIVSKVLMRLYSGHVPSSASVGKPNGKSERVTQLQGIRETCPEVAQPLASSSAGLDLKSRNIEQNECNRSDDAELNLKNCTEPVPKHKELVQHQKVYTVSLPPDDGVPGPKNDDDGSSSTENSDLHEDIEGTQPVERRKRRRRKKKENVTSPSYPDSKFNLQPIDRQPLQSDGVFINKNKKRKLQRKRQKERLKAAGLWPKTKTVALTNQPETKMVDNDPMEQSIAQNEEEMKKTEDLLDFLQATQEIYFTESKSRCADSALSIELVQEIMNQIKNGAVPFSELCILHQLKSLLLLQDIERLKDSLGSFKEHSSMPPGHILALHSLFCYWISDILPIKIQSTS